MQLFTDTTFPHVPKGLRDWFVLSEGGSWSGLCQTSAIQIEHEPVLGRGKGVGERGDPCVHRALQECPQSSLRAPKTAAHDEPKGTATSAPDLLGETLTLRLILRPRRTCHIFWPLSTSARPLVMRIQPSSPPPSPAPPSDEEVFFGLETLGDVKI